MMRIGLAAFADFVFRAPILLPVRATVRHEPGKRKAFTGRRGRGRKYPRAFLGANEASTRRHKRTLMGEPA
ncbi:protein of unknown function [Hyphomicrobium sp. 1Nfss2.1]